ncbi:MAG: hypothetical protein ABUS76_00465 [Candidatus Shikimatogenerans sp. Ttur]|uniref:DNA-directed RNA polymerase n=1 Tax=Candidatus Shikimatogenerans sp. Ttur TaxID=3158569 RepID=A0AAU7ZXS8_9FLAO
MKISNIIINNIKKKNKGYDSLYMMLNSGARGTKEQIKQISGIRGLISKPQKSSSYINIIETPIVSNFLEGMSILEYFISTHGSRKGLADTALKTADAGYLTRRLVDSSQNVIIDKYDCNTKNGIFIKKINKQIIGKFILTNIIIKNKYIIKNNNIITYNIYNKIKKYNIKNIYIRSILKCELYNNICVKCYGLNLSTNKLVRLGEAVGVIAAQSIGEPGTQLTLKTFHIGGTIKKINKKNKIFSKYNGYIKYYNLKLINHNIIISKNSYYIIYNKKKKKINKKRLLYGYKIYLNNNSIIKIGDKICSWDNYNNYIYSEYKGYIKYNNFRKNLNYYEVINKNTGYKNKIISKIKNKNNIPYLLIINKKKQLLKKYYLYEGNYILNNNKKKINIGDKLINIPKFTLKVNDITGGLPKLSNIFEMKKIKNKSKISEISGVINYDRINNNSRIIKVISNVGIIKSYKIKLYNKLLIQENEYIKYGDKITNGNISLNDILYIKGINKLKNKLIKKLQNIYITQGVYINDKHFEIIIKQMLKFVLIINVGNTNLVINNIINKYKFYKKNNKIKKKSIIINSGDSKKFKKNDIIFTKYIKFENFILKIKKKKIIKYIKCKPAIGKLIIKGISLSALKNNSFISSASFQETNKILNKASIGYTTDNLLGLKENVIIGNLIPSGTGYKKKII